ncbi:MAG: hypothetical protein KKH28_11210 [Elusimicrobia bacterium]|nr:hypothetical protein [Elusimicrobiota bacterium]
MSIKTIKAGFIGFWLFFPMSAGAPDSRLETIPFQITEKSRWQLEGAYNRILIDRAKKERIICLAPDGDAIVFDRKIKGIPVTSGAE